MNISLKTAVKQFVQDPETPDLKESLLLLVAQANSTQASKLLKYVESCLRRLAPIFKLHAMQLLRLCMDEGNEEVLHQACQRVVPTVFEFARHAVYLLGKRTTYLKSSSMPANRRSDYLAIAEFCDLVLLRLKAWSVQFAAFSDKYFPRLLKQLENEGAGVDYATEWTYACNSLLRQAWRGMEHTKTPVEVVRDLIGQLNSLASQESEADTRHTARVLQAIEDCTAYFESWKERVGPQPKLPPQTRRNRISSCGTACATVWALLMNI